jgi:hypothetical protein
VLVTLEPHILKLEEAERTESGSVVPHKMGTLFNNEIILTGSDSLAHFLAMNELPRAGLADIEFSGKRLIDAAGFSTILGSPIFCQDTSAGKLHTKHWPILQW